MTIGHKIIPVTSFSQNCSLIWCEQTKQAALVDPGGEIERLLAEVDTLGLELVAALATHGHVDHVAGIAELKHIRPIKVYGPHQADRFLLESLSELAARFGFPQKTCESFVPDVWLADGDTVKIGNISLAVKHIAGHTPGHVVYYYAEGNLLLGGDVLFYHSVGRTDLQMGSREDLINNIKTKLLTLPEETTVVPGHGPTTTIGHEKLENPFLK